MKELLNGSYVEMDEEEVSEINRTKRSAEKAERTRPMTEYEVTRLLIVQQINTLSVDDNTALRMLEFYPKWAELIGTTVDKAGFKFTNNGALYKTVPEQHTFQSDWIPGEGTESIYTRIDESHEGTIDDPIPYDGNMALSAGLYYTQEGVLYLCSSDTVNPVYHALRDLVGHYVEVKE